MSHAKKIYNSLLGKSNIVDMFPLIYIKDRSNIIVAKDGTESVLIEITGLDYSGMRDQSYDHLYNIRKRIFEKESPFYRLDIVSNKERGNAVDKIDTNVDNYILRMAKQAWRDQFDVVFRTRHFIVISVNNSSIMSKVGSLVSDDYKIDKEVELERLIDELKSELSDYSPRLLTKEECSSFYATQLNGRETYLNAKNWDQALSNQTINFDAKKNYCTYGVHGDTIFSGWLSISRYSEEITRHTLERIFKLPYRMNIYQSFKTHPKALALSKLKDRDDHLFNWGGANEVYSKELAELHAMISADKASLVNHSFAIEVLGDSIVELNDSVRAITNAITSDGQMVLFRESRNIEALFWSRFPTMHDFNLRKRDLTSENAGHLVTFNSIGEGFPTNGFGDKPVALFKTEEGGQYSFNFHVNGERKPDILGHTLFIGGTGSGKTTFISFLISMCLGYDNFKAIFFDRLGGLKVFTDMFDGEYLDFPEDVEMNPFQMEDNSVNRMFLFQWLKRLGGISESESKFNQKLNDIININYSLDKQDRCFKNLSKQFGRDGDELKERFESWLPGGGRSNFFNGASDSFSFKKDIITFDATYILDQPEILPVVTDYVFHQIMEKVSSSVVPHVIAFDEAAKYFQEPIFAKQMLEKLAEIRKKAGVCLLAVQNPNQLMKLGNVGGEVITALAHIVCYPNRTGKKEEYVDFLGLNETEFEWITTCNEPHKVLVKNRGNDSSVILDVNLSSLNTEKHNILKCFDSSSVAVEEVKKLKSLHPENWRLRYLRKK